MRILVIIFVLVLSSGIKSEAQVSLNQDPTYSRIYAITDSTFYFSDSNFLGTFQIIHRTKEREIFTHSIYTEIENRRSNKEVVLWDMTPLTTIRIFPRELIYPPMNFRVSLNEIVEIIEE